MVSACSSHSCPASELHSRKVSTKCASATTGPELGLTSPSDMIAAFVSVVSFNSAVRLG